MEQTQEEILELKKRIRQQEIEFYGDHELNIKEFDFNFDVTDGEYELDVLQQEMMQFYIRNDPKFRQAFYTDYTGLFIQVLKDKARLREPVHISIMGNVRSGKSYGGISILAIMLALQGKLILPCHICANAYKFLERIQEMPLEETNNTTFLRDEDKQPFGVGSISKKAKLQDVANIIAKHNISTLSLCPIKFADSESHYGLRTIGRNFKNKTTKYLLYNMQESKNSMIPMGTVILPIFTKLLPDWYAQPLEKMYVKVKDDWIADEIEGKGQDVLSDLKRKTAEKFMRDPQFMGLTNKKLRKTYIQQVMGSEWTLGELEAVLSLTEMMRNGIRFDDEPREKIEIIPKKIEQEKPAPMLFVDKDAKVEEDSLPILPTGRFTDEELLPINARLSSPQVIAERREYLKEMRKPDLEELEKKKNEAFLNKEMLKEEMLVENMPLDEIKSTIIKEDKDEIVKELEEDDEEEE